MKLVVIFITILMNIGLVFGQSNGGNQMFLENESKYSFDETIEKLNEIIAANSWKVITMHDLQAIMSKNGKDVLEVKVIETCNPNHAYKLLSKDDERIISSMLPCRISIYKKSNGKVFVSRINAEMFASQIGGLMGEVMNDAFNDIENIVKKVVK
jgi:uncharacterized protein (DUF302 family)